MARIAGIFLRDGQGAVTALAVFVRNTFRFCRLCLATFGLRNRGLGVRIPPGVLANHRLSPTLLPVASAKATLLHQDRIFLPFRWRAAILRARHFLTSDARRGAGLQRESLTNFDVAP